MNGRPGGQRLKKWPTVAEEGDCLVELKLSVIPTVLQSADSSIEQSDFLFQGQFSLHNLTDSCSLILGAARDKEAQLVSIQPGRGRIPRMG